MRWSWKLGRIAGIDLYVHATFLILIAWVMFSYWLNAHSLSAAMAGVGFILALFACVVLHEFGHALTAQRYGIQTRDITLLPIGGVARLERMPEDPRQELWVALAGPAVNVVIAALLFAWLQVRGSWRPLDSIEPDSGAFLERLLVANVFLVLFNLIPAFPMDGGRILRALLATRLEYSRATRLAATLGQGIALIFGLIGLFANPFLIFIALFVWIGAAQEAGQVQMRTNLGGIPVARAMLTDFRVISPDDPLEHAVNLILSGAQQDFPVVDDAGHVTGILTRDGLLYALAHDGRSQPVRDAMQRDFQAVDSHDMLETALAGLQNCQCQTMPVVHNGQLVGLLTTSNVGEFLAIQTALNGRSPKPKTLHA